MAIDFLALDVETANADVGSICQIGVVTFASGRAVDQWGRLVDPQTSFAEVNIGIHGITARRVQGAPTWPAVVEDLRRMCAGRVVVTHTGFDRAALRAACNRYGLPEIECTWLDSAKVARRAWEQFSRRGFSLGNLAREFGIQYQAHDAVEDARVCGEVVLRAVRDTGISVDRWVEVAGSRPRPVAWSRFARSGRADGPLAGKVVVFTGDLDVPRGEAARLAAEAGCEVADVVTRRTTFLVVGRNAGEVKLRRADELTAKGVGIQRLDEAGFLRLVAVPAVDVVTPGAAEAVKLAGRRWRLSWRPGPVEIAAMVVAVVSACMLACIALLFLLF